MQTTLVSYLHQIIEYFYFKPKFGTEFGTFPPIRSLNSNKISYFLVFIIKFIAEIHNFHYLKFPIYH